MCGTSVPRDATLTFPVSTFYELVAGVGASDSAPFLVSKKLVCMGVSARTTMLACYLVFGGCAGVWLLVLVGHGGVRGEWIGVCESD